MRTPSWIAALCLVLLPLGECGQGPAAQQSAAPVLAFRTAAIGAISTADWELTLRIRQLLAQDSDLAPLNPSVHVKSGIVTLSGPVPSAYFRRRAEERTLAVPGVRQVRNELAVRGTPAREPDLARQSGPIDKPGPPLPPQKLIGPPQPRNKPGPPVAHLASRVEVDSNQPAAPARASFAERDRDQDRADSDLRFAVERILRNNPRFAEVTAVLQDGRLVLVGSVRSQCERDDLLTALRRLEGVVAVQGDGVSVHGRSP